MAPKHRGSEKYYAIIHGHVDEPTIFSSWGDAHPRVTGYSRPKILSFPTLEEARAHMNDMGITKYKVVTRERAEENTPLPARDAFYAVANGRVPGIYSDWRKANSMIEKYPRACCKKFRTYAEAEEFIKNWKIASTEVYAKGIYERLSDKISG